MSSERRCRWCERRAQSAEGRRGAASFLPSALCPLPSALCPLRSALRFCATISPVRKWWVGLAALLYTASVSAATSQETPIASARVTSELRASLTHDYVIDVVVKPHEGDAWSRLAKRVTGDGENWKSIAAFNKAGDVLTTEQKVR